MTRLGSRLVTLLALLLTAALTEVPAQTVTPGAREILSLDFTSLPVGDFPKRNDLHTQSSLEIVDHNGAHMLKSWTLSDFLVDLPETLPDAFTVELDVVSQECCGSDDMSLETMRNDPNQNSAKLTWSPARQNVSGGGGSGFTASTTITRGQLAHIMVSVEGTTIKAYTDNARLYTVSGYRLTRGRVLRVWLNGSDEKKGAVFLSRIRVAEGAATVSQIVVETVSDAAGVKPTSDTAAAGGRAGSGTGSGNGSAGATTAATVQGLLARVDPQGAASLSWQPVQSATSYFVVRWLEGHPECCGDTSSPAGMTSLNWTGTPLVRTGTYGYRVYAYANGVIASGETKLQFPPPLSVVAYLSLGSNSPLGVLVAWSTVTNAIAYRVFRVSGSNQTSALLGRVSASASARPTDEGMAAAIDAELNGDAAGYKYWVQAELADGKLSDPGPVTPITVQGPSNPLSWGVPSAPTGVSASVGGTTTITFNGQQAPGSRMTWTWDQDLSRIPVYLYFATVDIASSLGWGGGGWTPYRSETIKVPGVPLFAYLKEGTATGPPYALDVPAGAYVRFCVSFFPLTDEVRNSGNFPGCVVSQAPSPSAGTAGFIP